MRYQQLAARYAKALLELAREEDRIDQIEAELKLLVNLLDKQKDLSGVLASPAVDLHQKKELLGIILQAQRISESVRDFLYLLLEDNRLLLLPAILSVYQDITFFKANRAKAIVESPVSLDRETKGLLKNRLSEFLDKDVELQTRINQKLLGGLRVKVGRTSYDASVKAKLESLTRSLIWR